MRKIGLLAASLCLSGCVHEKGIQHTGEVTVAKSVFDYHVTLQDKQGLQREFYYSEYQGTLQEGLVADIGYDCGYFGGSPYTMRGLSTCHIISIKIIKAIPPSESEVWNKQHENDEKEEAVITKSLSEEGYYSLIVIKKEKNVNTALAKSHKATNCDWTFQGKKVGSNSLYNGFICDGKILMGEVY